MTNMHPYIVYFAVNGIRPTRYPVKKRYVEINKVPLVVCPFTGSLSYVLYVQLFTDFSKCMCVHMY